MQPTLRELLRSCDQEAGGEKQRGVFLTMTDAERALLKETAYRARSTQAGVLRLGLRLVVAQLDKAGKG